MSGSVGGETAEPNLTPILDMVFQLITFFMLVTNFKAQALDEKLRLPAIGSAGPVKGDDDGLLILNIDTEGKLRVFGKIEDPEKFMAKEALHQRTTLNLGKDDEIPVTVIIRAHEETPFNKLNKVIKTAQDRGYRKFALKTRIDKPNAAAGK